ncbi:galactokinase family protein [Propionibacteriaceae bacterium G1746]
MTEDAAAAPSPLGWFAPGRIEVLGKHTDYAGGRSLLAAVDRGVAVHLTPADRGITARSGALPDAVTIEPNPGGTNSSSAPPEGHWGNYVQTVVDRLTENFGTLAPVAITVDSNLPLASGMSSSSALVVALAVSLAEYNGFTETQRWRSHIHSPVDLAGYLACFENGMNFGELTGRRGVGTFGGSEDHTAMTCATPDSLGLFSFGPITHERTLPFADDLAFVVAVSGVTAEKTGAARDLYNRAALAVTEIVRRWNDEPDLPTVTTLAQALHSDVDADAPLDRARRLLLDSPELTRRLEAFVVESEQVIPFAVEAFATADWAAFGRAVDESQQAASELLGNQVPQTESLARSARELGALAASGFGAGFGGSVWALVTRDQAEAFAEDWLARYLVEFPLVAGLATTLVTRPGGPIRPLD